MAGPGGRPSQSPPSGCSPHTHTDTHTHTPHPRSSPASRAATCPGRGRTSSSLLESGSVSPVDEGPQLRAPSSSRWWGETCRTLGGLGEAGGPLRDHRTRRGPARALVHPGPAPHSLPCPSTRGRSEKAAAARPGPLPESGPPGGPLSDQALVTRSDPPEPPRAAQGKSCKLRPPARVGNSCSWRGTNGPGGWGSLGQFAQLSSIG